MSLSFTVHPLSRLVTFTVEGTPSWEETREFFDAVSAHPDYECGFNFLGDCRGYAGDLSMAYARIFSKEVRARAQILGPSRWAMIVGTAAGFAAVRLCGLLTFGGWVEFAPFLTAAEATEWLGVGSAERRALHPV